MKKFIALLLSATLVASPLAFADDNMMSGAPTPDTAMQSSDNSTTTAVTPKKYYKHKKCRKCNRHHQYKTQKPTMPTPATPVDLDPPGGN